MAMIKEGTPKREKRLNVKVSDDEKRKVEDFVSKNGLNFSAWIRNLIFEKMEER
jgi:predicted DNA binding CopG/RHH family protein